MTKANYKAWAGNWFRGGANWLENRLNNTLNKDEEHDDRVMMRDAMTKLNQAADEIDRLYQVERERDFLISEYERAVKCGPQGFAHAAGHIYNAIVNAQCDVNTEHFIELQDQRDALTREVANAKGSYEVISEGYMRVTAERDALAAHVERLRDGFDSAVTWEDVREVFSDLPSMSLARLIAKKQAEAIGTVALKRPPDSVQRAWLLEQAEKWLCK